MKLRKSSETLMTPKEKGGAATAPTDVISLHQSASDLANLLKAYHENQSEAALDEIIGDTGANLAAAVDRRICFLDLLDANIRACTEAKEAWADRLKTLNALRGRSHERIKDIIQDNPEVDFAGAFGGISLQENPASLHTDLQTRAKSISNAVDALEVAWHGVPQKYVIITEVISLNTEAIRQDLKAGVELSWARLIKGKRVRWGANA